MFSKQAEPIVTGIAFLGSHVRIVNGCLEPEMKAESPESNKLPTGRLMWQYRNHEEFECDDAASWPDILSTKILPLIPDGSQVFVAIPPGKYQITQIDKPSVPDEEVEGAIPWLIKDLVSMPQEDMICDVFEPPFKLPGQPAKLNVVVSSRPVLMPLINVFQKAKVDLAAIVPQEFALPNILRTSPDARVVISQLKGSEASLQIIKDGKIYFSRWLRGFNRIHEYDEHEISPGISDSIGLEIQRSLDYYQSQLKQAPVKEIFISMATPYLDVLMRSVSETFQLKVFQLQFASMEESPLSGEWFPAIGAALEYNFYQEES